MPAAPPHFCGELQAAAGEVAHASSVGDDGTNRGAGEGLADGPEALGVGERVEKEALLQGDTQGEEELEGGPAAAADPSHAGWGLFNLRI
jgi:hypothetical protein